MWKIRDILKSNADERGTKQLRAIKKLEFNDICSVGLFTADMSFCNEYQNDQRHHKSGCKWKFMHQAFDNALKNLHFVQKMGKSTKYTILAK